MRLASVSHLSGTSCPPPRPAQGPFEGEMVITLSLLTQRPLTVHALCGLFYFLVLFDPIKSWWLHLITKIHINLIR